jgi:hypothetical protein
MPIAREELVEILKARSTMATFTTEIAEQMPDTRPGDYFVSAVDGGRHWLLSGPYASHAAALADVDAAKKLAIDNDPRAHFFAFGTCRYPLNSGKIGRLQKHNLLAIG